MAHGSIPQDPDGRGEPRNSGTAAGTHNRVLGQNTGHLFQNRDHHGNVYIFQGVGRRTALLSGTVMLTVAIVAAAAILHRSAEGEATEASPAAPSEAATPLPPPPSAPAEENASPEGYTPGETHKCRGWAEYVNVTHGALARPCVEFTGTSLLLSAEVMVDARLREETTGVVWVWLHHNHPLAADHDRNDLARDESTLFRCLLPLIPSDGELHVCGPFEVVPEKEGRFTTAMDTSTTVSELPTIWNNPEHSGTMLQGFHWPSGV